MTMSRNLADSLARDSVRVNHFNVGWVLTENEYHYKIADGLPHNWPEQIDRVTAPSGRLLSPEAIAEASVYWLSDASRPISGSVVDLEQYPFLGRNPSKEVE
jgi:NAD(P)-dependent dehydrogenase (short-subunit alcohol dehydrogenase family)